MEETTTKIRGLSRQGSRYSIMPNRSMTMKASSAVHGCALVRDIKSQTINPAMQATMRCALAVAIAQDRRTTANFFIEDSSDTEATGEAPL